jgi:hypothetical protein
MTMSTLTIALWAPAAALSALPAVSPPPVAAQETHVVAVVGLGGTPEFQDRFLGWALDLRAAAVERFGVASENALILAEDPAADPAVHDRSTREAFTETLEGLAGRMTPDDRVLLVLFGHGTFRDGEARLNLPGPDMSAEELAGLLDALPARKVAVVNTASASGPYLAALSAPGRAVITATSTGRERNETRFGGYFVEAFAADGADLDRDGTVSLLEAFTYARTETARSYESENLLLTEHARLDDDGDGEGSDEPAADAGGGAEMLDGAFAAGFLLGVPGRRGVVASGAAGAERTPPADSALARLYEARDSLELQVAELRARRSSMDPDDYDARLEALLLELARTSREIRDREGGGR